MSPQRTARLIAICLLTAPPVSGQAQQPEVSYAGALSTGRAFMIDTDSRDPAGGSSFTVSLERRRGDRALSAGLEAGFHKYLVIAQNLSGFSGWSSVLEDRRETWRLTPYLRWRTRGDLSVHAQLGGGLYVPRISYFHQEHESGETVFNQSYEITRAQAGINLGVGLELFIPGTPVGLGLGFRSHVVGGGNGFNTGEIGIVWRAGGRAPVR